MIHANHSAMIADDRIRTSTWLPRVDFESTASTISPHRQKDSSIIARKVNSREGFNSASSCGRPGPTSK